MPPLHEDDLPSVRRHWNMRPHREETRKDGGERSGASILWNITMASTLIDLAIMTPSSAFGTSATIPLGSAAVLNSVTYLSFATAGATGGTQVSYSLQDPINGGSEIGTATYTSSNTTLTNRTPTKSTAGSSYINASSGCIITGVVRGEDLNSFIVAGQLLGTSSNDSASSGNVGEYVTNQKARASAAALTSSGITVISSISLTAGDWDVWGIMGYNGTSSNASIVASWGTSSTALAGLDSNAEAALGNINVSTIDNVLNVPMSRVSLAATTTYYMNAYAAFGVGTVSAFGTLLARRRR